MRQRMWDRAGHLTSDALDEYVLKRLSESEVAQADAHLRKCKRCRAKLKALRDVVEGLRSASRPPPPDSEDDDTP